MDNGDKIYNKNLDLCYLYKMTSMDILSGNNRFCYKIVENGTFQQFIGEKNSSVILF